MIFQEGVFYIGYLNNKYWFHGEGIFYFAVGGFLRGNFNEGKVHGKCLITLPTNIILIGRFEHGVLKDDLSKINIDSKTITHHKKIMESSDYL